MVEADPTVVKLHDLGFDRRAEQRDGGRADDFLQEVDGRLSQGGGDGEDVLGLGRQSRQLLSEQGSQVVGEADVFSHTSSRSSEYNRLSPDAAQSAERRQPDHHCLFSGRIRNRHFQLAASGHHQRVFSGGPQHRVVCGWSHTLMRVTG